MALKHEELLASKAELERRGGQVAALQRDLDAQTSATRELQVRPGS